MPIVPFIVGVVILFVILKVLSMPMKIIVNLFGVGLALNWITSLIVGFLGVPGVIIVAILQFVLQVI